MTALPLAFDNRDPNPQNAKVVPGPWPRPDVHEPFAPPAGNQDRLGRYAKGTQIIFSGSPASQYFEVVDGVVSGYSELLDGRRQVLEFFLPGDIFGFSPNGRFPYSAEAVTPVVLRKRPVASQDVFGNGEAADIHRLLDSTLMLLQAAQDRLLLLGRKTARERLASFLLSMAARAGADADGRVDLPMTRLAIADYLGLTIETVSRTVSELRREGIIGFVTDCRHIVLLDLDTLSELAGIDGDPD